MASRWGYKPYLNLWSGRVAAATINEYSVGRVGWNGKERREGGFVFLVEGPLAQLFLQSSFPTAQYVAGHVVLLIPY